MFCRNFLLFHTHHSGYPERVGSKLIHTDTPQGSNRRLYKAASIGNIAFDTLSADQEARVVGKTSRGMFIKSANKWLLFISCEPFRSPMTITTVATGGLLQNVTSEMLIQISSRQLIFPDAFLIISTQNSVVWRSPSPSNHPLPYIDRLIRLNLAAKQVINSKKGIGLAPLLPLLLKVPGSTYLSTQGLSTFQANIIQLYEKMRSSARPNSANFMISLLGNGSGLTPSGDDFVMGFLLALNRWTEVLFPGYDPKKLNKIVVDAAYEKTTTLSANLIECAARGQGDERLIAALDWLIGGTTQDSGHIDEMLRWGSSSGVDVFAGFVAALSLQSEATGLE